MTGARPLRLTVWNEDVREIRLDPHASATRSRTSGMICSAKRAIQVRGRLLWSEGWYQRSELGR
ncbi:hypothetical protein GCM10027416_22620 [Okibacterium endophyticum]